MRSRKWLWLVVLATTGYASPRKHSVKNHAAPDEDYIAALSTANHFLYAWQTGDQETGILLLTNAAKRHCSEDRLDGLFSVSHPAYEIAHGKKVQTGRYAFPVVIFQVFADKDRSAARPRYTELIVTRTGKNDWAVDKLP